MRCDIKAQNPKYISRLEEVDKIERMYKEIIQTKQCFSLKQLEINGNDLMQSGVPKGKLIRDILNKLLDMVINNEIENNRDILLERVMQIKY